MSQIKTYIFGNPAGWSLYEGDPQELDYFKNFYRSTRHGSRLMVNRRNDGTTVYTYINYDIHESSDRYGDAHFGMAIVLSDSEYVPQFNAMYRFMNAIFHKLMEMESPIFLRTKNGNIRYNIDKFSDAASTIENIKSTLPKIIAKCGTASITADPKFKEGLAGEIKLLPDNGSDPLYTDEKVLDAFRNNQWIAISPEFKTSTGNGPSPKDQPFELDLFGMMKSLQSFSNRLTAMALGKVPVTAVELDWIDEQVGRARSILYKYINTNPEDIEAAKDCENAYNDLYPTIDTLKERLKPKPDSSGQDTGGSNDGNGPDPRPPRPPKPKLEIPAWVYGAGAVLVLIVALLLGLKSCSSSDDNSGGAGDGTDQTLTSDQLREKYPEILAALDTCNFIKVNVLLLDPKMIETDKKSLEALVKDKKEELHKAVECLESDINKYDSYISDHFSKVGSTDFYFYMSNLLTDDNKIQEYYVNQALSNIQFNDDDKKTLSGLMENAKHNSDNSLGDHVSGDDSELGSGSDVTSDLPIVKIDGKIYSPNNGKIDITITSQGTHTVEVPDGNLKCYSQKHGNGKKISDSKFEFTAVEDGNTYTYNFYAGKQPRNELDKNNYDIEIKIRSKVNKTDTPTNNQTDTIKPGGSKEMLE